jgi:ribosomal protein L9
MKRFVEEGGTMSSTIPTSFEEDFLFPAIHAGELTHKAIENIKDTKKDRARAFLKNSVSTEINKAINAGLFVIDVRTKEDIEVDVVISELRNLGYKVRYELDRRLIEPLAIAGRDTYYDRPAQKWQSSHKFEIRWP